MSAAQERREGGRVDPATWQAPVTGVLGGLGPAATAVFLDLLVRATDAASDQDHLDLLLSQHSTTPDRTARILDPGAPDPGPVIEKDAVMLERAGAEVLVLPCNTAHHFVQRAERATTAELLGIVGITAQAAAAAIEGTGRSVAIFATAGTVAAGVYQEALETVGARALVPDPALQDSITAIIYEQVKANREVDLALFDACVDEAIEQGAGTVVLGCTELSVIYDKSGYRGDPRMVDSLTELARATVRRAGKPLSPAFR